jgi:hypothetical protein
VLAVAKRDTQVLVLLTLSFTESSLLAKIGWFKDFLWKRNT